MNEERTGKCLRQVEHIINRPFKDSCYSIFCFICNVVCPFVHFLLVILLFVLLRFTDSDYPFGIFKLFLNYIKTYKSISVRLKYSRCLFFFLFHLQKLILELIFSVECFFIKLQNKILYFEVLAWRYYTGCLWIYL